MEKSNFLQRPGGLGPMAERVKPIGSMGLNSPANYQSTPQSIELNRATGIDNVNRVYAQYQIDHGEYARAAIGPTDFNKGNIVESQELTGPAGYNHRNVVMPMRPMDMTQAEYMVKEQNTMDPELRVQLKTLTTNPRQNFLNGQDQSANMMSQNYNMPDNLPFPNTTPQKK
jgi:hypothetical protein